MDRDDLYESLMKERSKILLDIEYFNSEIDRMVIDRQDLNFKLDRITNNLNDIDTAVRYDKSLVIKRKVINFLQSKGFATNGCYSRIAGQIVPYDNFSTCVRVEVNGEDVDTSELINSITDLVEDLNEVITFYSGDCDWGTYRNTITFTVGTFSLNGR